MRRSSCTAILSKYGCDGTQWWWYSHQTLQTQDLMCWEHTSCTDPNQHPSASIDTQSTDALVGLRDCRTPSSHTPVSSWHLAVQLSNEVVAECIQLTIVGSSCGWIPKTRRLMGLNYGWIPKQDGARIAGAICSMVWISQPISTVESVHNEPFSTFPTVDIFGVLHLRTHTHTYFGRTMSLSKTHSNCGFGKIHSQN